MYNSFTCIFYPNVRYFEEFLVGSEGFYFGNEIDGKGDRWASRLQAWLELQSGDARQQDVAKDIRSQILSRGGASTPETASAQPPGRAVNP